MSDKKQKFSAVNQPPPPVQQLGGAGWVIAQVGNPLSGRPPTFLVGSAMCVNCFPKQVPAFHVFGGNTLCPDCLAVAKGLKTPPKEDAGAEKPKT